MSEEKVSKYTKVVETTSNGREVTKYKLNGRLVKAAEVSEEIKEGLSQLEVGQAVDEKGVAVDAPTPAPEATPEAAPEVAPESDEAVSEDQLEDFDGPTDDEPEEDAEEEVVEETPPAPVVTTEDKKPAAKKPAAKKAKTEEEDPASPVREDELPGGPQEPVVATPQVEIDSADDVDDETGDDVEEQDRAARLRAGLERDEEGMGFPRKKGKTVDVFDGKTPHTHVRNVAGHMVPLTQANYETKTDAEIVEKLRKLGKVA